MGIKFNRSRREGEREEQSYGAERVTIHAQQQLIMICFPGKDFPPLPFPRCSSLLLCPFMRALQPLSPPGFF